MINMEQPHILYDSQIFDLQKFGGISRYFCEIISKLDMAYDISVRFTENHYLAQAKLAGHDLRLCRQSKPYSQSQLCCSVLRVQRDMHH